MSKIAIWVSIVGVLFGCKTVQNSNNSSVSDLDALQKIVVEPSVNDASWIHSCLTADGRFVFRSYMYSGRTLDTPDTIEIISTNNGEVVKSNKFPKIDRGPEISAASTVPFAASMDACFYDPTSSQSRILTVKDDYASVYDGRSAEKISQIENKQFGVLNYADSDFESKKLLLTIMSPGQRFNGVFVINWITGQLEKEIDAGNEMLSGKFSVNPGKVLMATTEFVREYNISDASMTREIIANSGLSVISPDGTNIFSIDVNGKAVASQTSEPISVNRLEGDFSNILDDSAIRLGFNYLCNKGDYLLGQKSSSFTGVSSKPVYVRIADGSLNEFLDADYDLGKRCFVNNSGITIIVTHFGPNKYFVSGETNSVIGKVRCADHSVSRDESVFVCRDYDNGSINIFR